MTMDKEFFLSGKPVRNEIEDLHTFFENWFNGTENNNNANRFTDVLGDEFLLISPNGEKYSKETISEMIREGYDSATNRRIWVENISTRAIGDVVIATYNELQMVNEEQTNRLSTAVFSFDANMPNYCVWEQVHETWIQK